jgi:hypothetical protein
MIKKAIHVLTLCLLMAYMSSCQTQEGKVINKMHDLAERVESKSETYNDEELDNVINEYKALLQQADECDFTTEQMKEVTKVKAELAIAIDKQVTKKIGKDIYEAIDEGMEAIEGTYDIIKEGFSGDDTATEK